MNARWRSLEREQTGLSNVTEEYGPEYDPIAGVGFGVRFNEEHTQWLNMNSCSMITQNLSHSNKLFQ